MISLFQSHGFNLKAIACVRSPCSFHTSRTQHAIREAIKFGKHAPSLKKFVSQKERIERLHNLFGKSIHFVSFRQACMDPQGPVGAILRLCDVIPDQLDVHKSNQGGDNISVRKALDSLVSGEASQWNEEARTSMLKSMVQTTENGQKFQLTADEFDAIKSNLDDENQAFLSLLGPEFCDPYFTQSNGQPADQASYGSSQEK